VVLDGGLSAWLAAVGSTQSGPSRDLPGNSTPYPAAAPLVGTVDAVWLQQQLGRVRLLDARAPERFRGDVEPLDKAAGHIPGALNRFFKDNLDAQGRFRSAAALRQDFEQLLSGQAAEASVHQCGSGVTACHNLLAMAVAGLPPGRLYPGSWSEWSDNTTRPVARG
jgi:thiosulfate/3-mercaptopyruvate sulfurtransferase